MDGSTIFRSENHRRMKPLSRVTSASAHSSACPIPRRMRNSAGICCASGTAARRGGADAPVELQRRLLRLGWRGGCGEVRHICVALWRQGSHGLWSVFASSLIDFFPLGIAAGGVKIWYNYGMRKILLVSAAAISAISAFANSWDDVLLKGRSINFQFFNFQLKSTSH